MFDFGLRSLEALTFKHLGYLLAVIVACIAAIVVMGVDGILVAIAIRYAIAVVAEVVRRVWRLMKSRLCAPTEPPVH